MSNLTTEQISELHDLALARLSEFDSVAAHFPKLVPGVVRIVVEVYEEWLERETEPRPWPNTLAAEDPLADGFHIGYQMAQRKYATRMDGSDHTNGTDHNLIRIQTDIPSPTITAPTDSTITAGDYAEFEAAWPAIPDLQGEDVFAAEHGAPTGEPEQEPAPEPPRPIGRDRAPDVVAINKPRPLSVVDAEAKRQAELAEIVAHLQRIAKGKRLPSMTDYHGTRPKHLPMWPTMQSRHNLSSWSDMAALTGLEYGKRHLRVADDEPEIDPDLDADDLDDDAADGDDAPATKRKRPNGTRIKHPRKMGYEYGTESKPGRKAQAPETLPELIKAVQGMAMAGVMPTQSQFDTAKPVVWPRATSLMSRFNMSWEQLREMAGLKPNPRWGATWQQADAAAA